MVKRCLNAEHGTCKSAYQDKQYGLDMRVHNARKSDSGEKRTPRCTVCGREN